MSNLRANELLGHPPDARLLIINADDFGVYHAVNAGHPPLTHGRRGAVHDPDGALSLGVARHAAAPRPSGHRLRRPPDRHLRVRRLPVGAADPPERGAVPARRDRLLLQQRSAGRVTGPRQAGRAGGRVPRPDRGSAGGRPEADAPRLALPARRWSARHLRPDVRAGQGIRTGAARLRPGPGANDCSGGDCPPSTTEWWTARGWRRRARRTGLLACCGNCRPG